LAWNLLNKMTGKPARTPGNPVKPVMPPTLPDNTQSQFLLQDLSTQLDATQELCRLKAGLPWTEFAVAFGPLYSPEGRPAKPIQRMVGLLLLKQLRDLSDEAVCAQWAENPYFQYFCGERVFQWGPPCEPSDLVHFRHRLGPAGMEKIFAVSIALHGAKARESAVVADTTVQEKAIQHPTDARLYRKVAQAAVRLAAAENLPLRRSYRRTLPRLAFTAAQRRTPTQKKAARRATRQLKTIAGRLRREVARKLSPAAQAPHAATLALWQRALAQKKTDQNKIYSLHEPQVCCIGKGKAHKKWEFGAKASVLMTKTGGVLVGAHSFPENRYDGDTLPEALAQTERLTGARPAVVIADRGYRGRELVGATRVVIPQAGGPDEETPAQRRHRRACFRRRAAIEPRLGHLKSDYRLGRNFLRGSAGDAINLLLAATAANLRLWLRTALFWRRALLAWLRSLLAMVRQPC
jgi:IS5 family transposase